MTPIGRFLSRWQNWLGVLVVLFFFAVALAAPLLSPMDPENPGPFQQVGRSTDSTPRPPSQGVPLGTLPGQVDVYHALVWGTRDAVQFGLLVALGAFVFGVLFGAVSGYVGGAANSIMMRITDAFLTFPVIAGVVFLQELVAVTIEAMGGTYWFNNYYRGKVVYFQFTPPLWVSFLLTVDPVLICLILFSWMPYARLINSVVLAVKRTEYVQAARAIGGSTWWILRRHVLPNSIDPTIVLAARDVGAAVTLQATFTFIGIGGNAPWGKMLALGRDWVIGPGGNLLAYWWVFLPATLAVVLFGFGWNLLGDGINDLLETRTAGGGVVRAPKRKKAVAKSRRLARPDMPPGLKPVPEPVSFEDDPSGHAAAYYSPENDPVFVLAQDAVTQQDVSGALRAYEHLIRRGRWVHETVRGLAVLAQQNPENARAWQTLGDALDRAGNKELAARAYARYRKLSR